MDKIKLMELLEQALNDHDHEMDGFGNGFEAGLEKAIEIAQAQGESLPIGSVSKCYTEKDMDNAYDKGFKDGSQRDLTGSLIEVL